jgi:protein suppressor of PHYA-105 1
MEGATELNHQDNTIQNPTEAQVQLTKETHQPHDLHVESASLNADTTAPPISRDPDWSEHFSFLSSSKDAFMENTDRTANLNPSQTENSAFNPEVVVEELTLKNYRSATNISAGSSSTSGEKPSTRKGLWGNFTRLAESLSRENAPINQPISQMVEGGSDDNPPFGSQRTRNNAHPLFGAQRAPQSTIRPQTISEFTQIGAKSAFKGKEVVQKGAIIRPKFNVEKRSDISHENCVNSDEKSLYGGGAFKSYNLSSHKGINLREFLKPRYQRISKSEKMQIFRQIVELLNVSHSQGLAFKDLQPSYFMILPHYQVKYIGGFIPQEMSSSAQMEESFRKKRHLDQKEMQKRSSWVSRLKHQKVGDQGFLSRSTNTGCDFRENTSICADTCKFEERWYSSPEEQTEYMCPFSSNIYSLGVLLFEVLNLFSFICFMNRMLPVAKLHLRLAFE